MLMKTEQTDSRPNAQTYLCIFITLLLWGSSFPSIRYAVDTGKDSMHFSPGALALFRFLVASAVALLYLAITRQGLPDKPDLPKIFIAGLFGISFYHVLYNFGSQVVLSGAAAALIACSPIFVALMSAIVFHERLRWGWLGIVLSLIGVVVIGFVDASGLTFDIHVLALLGSALATAVFFMQSKRLLKKYSGLRFTSYALIAGTIPLLVFTPQLVSELPQAAPGAIASVIYLGVFPAFVGYALWNIALTRMEATRQTVFLNTSPLFAAAIAWAWLGEIPTLLVYIGGLIIIAGVLMVQLSSMKTG
jgi:drug/metabolite transporter (DMT)-like permease